MFLQPASTLRPPAAVFSICGVICVSIIVCTQAESCCATETHPEFESNVQPIMIAHCYDCHGARNRGGGTDLRSVALMTGSQAGHRPVVVSGKPDASRMYRLLQDGRMPPIGPLEPGDVQIIRSWIAAGCPATAPHAVYGATFFQNWGLLLGIVAILNIVTVGVLGRGTLNLATALVVLSGLPMLGLLVSQLFWYPPDRFGIAAAVLMAAGLTTGGILIGRSNGKHPCLAAVCTLLGPLGLIVLSRRRNQVPNDEGHAPATDGG